MEREPQPLKIAPKFKATPPPKGGIWSPNIQQQTTLPTPPPPPPPPSSSLAAAKTKITASNNKNTVDEFEFVKGGPPIPPPPPIWAPTSTGSSPIGERKEFKRVNFTSPVLGRKNTPLTKKESNGTEAPPPWTYSELEKPIVTPDTSVLSTVSPSNGSGNGISAKFSVIGNSVSFPKSQNPTITLLHRARDLRKAIEIESVQKNSRQCQKSTSVPVRPNEIESIKVLNSENTIRLKKMTELQAPQIDDIGPTTKDGMPIVLRSEVNEHNQSKWYKKMYNTLHKAKFDDDILTVRYKTRRGRYPYKSSGYMSEPEPNYDSDYSIKYRSANSRRIPWPTPQPKNDRSYGTMPNPIKTGAPMYKNQPGRIENYTPGQSSISEKETKQWWDEVMEIFDGHLEQQKHVHSYSQGYLSRALKDQGYESDSQLVFRKRADAQLAPLSPIEQRQAYRNVQAGGDAPLQGFRKSAPEKLKDDSSIEYIPITSTLTKIRIHKKRNRPFEMPSPQREILCYPITNISRPIDLFGPFPKQIQSFVPVGPPTPPNRKSSRTNSTLKMFTATTTTTTSIATATNTTTSTANNSSNFSQIRKTMNSTRDDIEHQTKGAGLARSLATTTNTTTTLSSCCMSTSYTTTSLKEEKNLENTTRIAKKSSHFFHRVKSASPVSRSQRIEVRKSSASPIAFGRGISKERTFAEERKRLEKELPQLRKDVSTSILRNPDLKSPDAVKKAILKSVKSPTLPMKDRSNFLRGLKRSASNPKTTCDEKALRVTVAICSRGKELLRASTETLKYKGQTAQLTTPIVIKSNFSRSGKTFEHQTVKSTDSTRTNSQVSLARTNSTFSIDSSCSRRNRARPQTICGKSQISTPITIVGAKLKKKKTNTKLIPIKRLTNNPKQTDQSSENDESSHSLQTALVQHKDTVCSDSFFQSLFLQKRASPTPSATSSHIRTTAVLERARKWNTSTVDTTCERQPSIYLKQKRPVSDSKFKINDRISRSASPPTEQRSDHALLYDRLSKYDAYYIYSEDEGEFGGECFNYAAANQKTIDNSRTGRSPSSRRIQSMRQSNSLEWPRKVTRTRSLSAADRFDQSLKGRRAISYSSCSLNSCPHHKSERFRELNTFYSNLERVGQLEKATSSNDLRSIRRDEEIIDFDLWKKVRARDRAERELKCLVDKLKQDQREKDLLFQPHDVDSIKWQQMRDSGLRTKEKSVEDLRDIFKKKSTQTELEPEKRREIESSKDTYTPFWRGSSVLDLASSMVVKFNPGDIRPNIEFNRDTSDHFSHRATKMLGLSRKLMSTLSKDQIDKIKDQLSEIYNNQASDGTSGSTKSQQTEHFVITVPNDRRPLSSSLTVRSNSFISRDELLHSKVSVEPDKTGSVNSIYDCMREGVPPKQETPEITEAEKRRLSLTLCREIQDKQEERRNRTRSPIFLAKETRGAVAAENAKLSLPDTPPCPRPCLSLSIDFDRKPMVAKAKVTLKPKSGSFSAETESLSSGVSQLTVIHNAAAAASVEDIQSKIKFFEMAKSDDAKGTTIYHAREDSSPDEDEIMRLIEEKRRRHKSNGHSLSGSQSFTDLKGFFGERPQMQSLPVHQTKKSRSVSPSSRTIVATGATSYSNSVDSVYQSRSVSPDTAHYYRAGFNFGRAGDVQRIREQYESLDLNQLSSCDASLSPNRFATVPSTNPFLGNRVRSPNPGRITVREHESSDVASIAHKFEARASRGRTRTRRILSPIPKTSLKKDDRFMPHIDIISKTAALKQVAKRQMAPVDTIIQSGEVEKIKSRFESSTENVSLLGEMYTSSPDIRELKDISSYLSGSWVAHKFPKPQDNARSVVTLEHGPQNRAIVKRGAAAATVIAAKRPKSTSPIRPKGSATSILKPFYRTTIFDEQFLDIGAHKPKRRFLPDRRIEAEFLWKRLQQNGIKKTTVKFEESAVVPPPPPIKGVPLSSYDQNPESPRRYVESDVNIHYRAPIRYEFKEAIPEDELARRQAEAMKRIYQEERRRKYLQELQDMNNRRHTDNFTPSQKSPISLSRYDDISVTPSSAVDVTTHSQQQRSSAVQHYSNSTLVNPLQHIVARALYNFLGQNVRELTFKKGDIIFIRRQIDKNWYEGEHNGAIGLLPFNYVEILTKDGGSSATANKKPTEGQARAKYNFYAQSAIELSLNKGELVTLTRRVDANWFEGRIANRKGIFPVSYVDVLTDIGANDFNPLLPMLGTNSTNSTGTSHPVIDYTNLSSNGNDTAGYAIVRPHDQNSSDAIALHGRSVSGCGIAELTNGHLTNGNGGGGPSRESKTMKKTEILHVDTNSEPIAFRALYKYRPQNSDELELDEGDIVYVLEKCDDGWYVGTSQRTGYFGTFPGNYVEKI